MSEQPKKRPWLQFHLSTAVVLMFVAAGLLWMNMRPATRMTELEGSILYVLGRCSSYGWPVAAYEVNEATNAVGNATETGEARIVFGDLTPKVPKWTWQTTYWIGVTVDAAVVVVTCFVAAILFELRIRRKSAQAEPPMDGPN